MFEEKSYLFELQSGDFCEVDRTLTRCTCAEFKQKNSCVHVLMAQDLFLNRGKNYRYHIWSAFHKSIRLNMAKESICWLEVLLKISNPSQIRKYTENLLLEDSRAFHLKEQSMNKLPLRDLVLRAALVRKKWNLEYLRKAKSFDLWVDAYLIESVQSISNLENRDLLSCYQLNWSIRKNKQLEGKFWELARESTAKNAVVKRIHRVYQKGSYARCLILEALNGIWSDEAFHQDTEPRIGENAYVPYLHLWVQDIHVWGGYNRIKRLGASYLNNTFKQDQLDLRASGMVAGVGYRHRANESGFTINGYSLPTWESIPIDAKSWQKWIHLDQHFYPKTIKIK